MAATYRNKTSSYQGYDLSYDGNAAVEQWAPSVGQPAPLVRPKEQPRTKTRPKSRTKLRVRPRENVSPFAIVGFLAVGIFAVVLLLSYVQLTEASDSVVRLKNELSTLQAQEEILQAKYERTFDLVAIEEQFASTGLMAKPRTDQVFYVDMSGPDNAQIIGQEDRLQSTAGTLQEFFAMAVEYFK